MGWRVEHELLWFTERKFSRKHSLDRSSHQVTFLNQITKILSQVESGDAGASAELLPLVYEHLRVLARARMSAERSNHTLCPTELVHQAYVRLVDNQASFTWVSRGHFFSAAAEAMRRILVEHARRRSAIKRGGAHPGERLSSEIEDASATEDERILSVNDALEVLGRESPRQAELIKLRYFGGLTLEEAAQTLNISLATAKRDWASAKVFIYRRLSV